MNDDQRLLTDMADELFGRFGATAGISEHWPAIEAVALPMLLVAESQGGFGGSWEDATLVFRLAGYHALSLPVPEAIVAAAVSGRAEGRGTIAGAADGALNDGSFSGTIHGICFADGADYVVAPAPGGGSMILELGSPGVVAEARKNLADEDRQSVIFSNSAAVQSPLDVHMLGALARVAQIAGALDAALEKSVAYANERQQFGRALARFQAVQQNLATFACEAAATNCAAIGAGQAMSRGNAAFEISAAKIRANRAVGIGTALAHQIHGAIGFTQEYSLHPLTRRLWAWRSEFGSDALWSARLGARIVAAGADAFWPDLTALTD